MKDDYTVMINGGVREANFYAHCLACNKTRAFKWNEKFADAGWIYINNEEMIKDSSLVDSRLFYCSRECMALEEMAK
ncbi:hypothetical protein L0244_39765 [bacterium]|nr:hypothetical protein [bacterium]